MILEKKGHDYATEDQLSNFKRMALLSAVFKIDITRPTGVALFYKLLKLDRLANLLSNGKQPMNESMEDTLDDDINYTELLRGLIVEKADAKASAKMYSDTLIKKGVTQAELDKVQ